MGLHTRTLFLLFFSLLVFITGCGGGDSAGTLVPRDSGTPGQPATSPSRVFLVVMENKSFNQIIGNANAPFTNELAGRYGLATRYYANIQPSLPNYFMMTAGDLVTNTNSYQGPYDGPNLVRQFKRDNKSWKAYLESLPSVGYTGDGPYPYAKRHNPFAYYTDVLNDAAERNKLVPLTQLDEDLRTGNLPQFIYILPNDISNSHDCPKGGTSCTEEEKIRHGDEWLRRVVGGVLSSPNFGNSVVILTYDEGNKSDFENGGGHIATIIAGPRVKSGFRSTTFYQHQSALRLICDQMGLSACPGAGATAPPMSEFFQ